MPWEGNAESRSLHIHCKKNLATWLIENRLAHIAREDASVALLVKGSGEGALQIICYNVVEGLHVPESL
jgi:hypothetical protein